METLQKQQCSFSIVGAIILNGEGHIASFLRNTDPKDVLACPAGHVDDNLSNADTVEKEVLEEVGLTIVQKRLVTTLYIPYACSRQRFYGQDVGHTWHVYECTVEEYDHKTSDREVVTGSFAWRSPEELDVPELENCWRYIFTHLGIL